MSVSLLSQGLFTRFLSFKDIVSKNWIKDRLRCVALPDQSHIVCVCVCVCCLLYTSRCV